MKNVRLLASIAAGSLLLSATALAEVDKKAERGWKAKCASCHGQAGKGDTDKGKELKIGDMSSAAFKAKSDTELQKAVLEGVKLNGTEVMPSFKDDVTPEQAAALIQYIRTFQ